jgi:heptosyltransferase-2
LSKYRILLVRIDRIGDVVLTTAIPREIKLTYPDSFIAVMVKSYTKDIYLNNPFVDEIIIADKYLSCSKSEVFKYAANLKKYNFTHSFLILPNEKLNYIIFLAGIKHRFGTGYKFYQFITGVKGLSRKKYNPLRHEADYCMDFARAIGVKTENINSEIYLDAKEREKANNLREEILSKDKEKKIIGIHLSSGNSAPNWELEDYIQLIEKLLLSQKYVICVTDNVIPDKIEQLKNVIYLNKNNDLRTTIVNISILDVLVAASTGPLHLAAGLKVKTVALFCPMTACSPKLWKPVGNKSVELIPTEDYCLKNCPGDPKKCTFKNNGIPVEDVINAIESILK